MTTVVSVRERAGTAAHAGRLVLTAGQRRVAAVVTPLGGNVIALGVLSAIAGWWLGWREADLIAVACTLLMVIAGGYLLGTAGVETRVAISRNRVEAGHNARVPAAERARLSVTVENTGVKSAGWLTVDVPMRWSGGRAIRSDSAQVAPLQPGATGSTDGFDLPTARRGVIEVGPASVVRTDPLGLLRREVARSEAAEFVIHPRTAGVDKTGAGLLRDLEGQTSNDISTNDVAFHALREYEPGDSLRHVHALTSARLGRLMVRQFLDTRAAHLTVVVSGARAEYQAEEEFETALSIGCSLALGAIRDDQRVSVFAAGDEKLKTSHVTNRLALDGFSRARLGAPDSSLTKLATRAIRIAPETSLAALVTGRGATMTQIQSAAARFGPGVQVVGIRVIPGAKPEVKRSGRIRMLTVPELGDLRRAMRSGVNR